MDKKEPRGQTGFYGTQRVDGIIFDRRGQTGLSRTMGTDGIIHAGPRGRTELDRINREAGNR
jgi:hypothetical protein